MPDELKKQAKEEKKELKKSEKLEKEIELLNEKIKKLEADAEQWKNDYYRAYADTKNLRNSLEKDHQMFVKYRAEGFVENLFPVLDSFHMALANEPTDPALKNYLVGFQYIYKNLVSVLEAEGVTEIDPVVDKPFNAETMNAVDTVEVNDEKEVNLVKKVYSKGYKLHERLIRPANVVVGKLKEEPKQEDKNEEAKIDA